MDGVFFAVTLVIINHFFENSGFGMAHKYLWHGPWLIFEFPANLGILGVHVFFVISGYVIARGMDKEGQGNFRLSEFWIKRAARIIPPFYFYLFFITILGLLGIISITPKQSIKAGLFLCNILGSGWWTGHSWSLDYEEQFYLLFPLFFMFSPKKFVPCLYVLMVVLALMKYPVGFNFSLLLMGVLCARYAIPLGRSKALLFASCAYLLLNALIIQNTLSLAISKILVPPAIAFLLFSHAQVIFHRVLNIGWIVILGQASYGIYLWQELVTGDLLGANLKWYIPALVAVYIVPLMMFLWIERPMQRRVRQFLSERRARSV